MPGLLIDYLEKRSQNKAADRDFQAESLGKQAQGIAENIRKALPEDYKGNLDYASLSKLPEVAPLADQLQQITQQHNALYQPHEAPALVRNIEKFFGRTPKTKPAQNQSTIEGEMAAAPSPRLPGDTNLSDLKKELEWIKNNVPPEEQADQILATTRKRLGESKQEGSETAISPNEIVQQGDKYGIYEKDRAGSVAFKEIPGFKPKVKTGKPTMKPTFHAQTGGLTTLDVTDPETGEVATYHAGNIKQAPQEAQDEWNAIDKQTKDALAAKQKEEDTKEARKEALVADREHQLLSRALDERDYASAITAYNTVKKGYDDAKRSRQLAIDALKDPNNAVAQRLLIDSAVKGQLGRATQEAIDQIATAGGVDTRISGWEQKLATGGVAPKILNDLAAFINNDFKARSEDLADNQKALVDLKKKIMGGEEKPNPGDLKKKAAPQSSSQPQRIVVSPEDMK